MLSTVADLTQLAQLAPWLVVALLSLVTSWWVYRQHRTSARAQGERLGKLETRLDSERTRRRQSEAVLCELGIPLPYWPPDGPDQPRPARTRWHDDEDNQQDHYSSNDLEPYTAHLPVSPPVPPLEQDLARHRRSRSY